MDTPSNGSLGRLGGQHHVRKAQQCLLDGFAQLVRAHFIAHADGVARHTGDGFMGVIQEDFCIAVRAEQRVIHGPQSIIRRILYGNFSISPCNDVVNQNESNLHSIMQI